MFMFKSEGSLKIEEIMMPGNNLIRNRLFSSAQNKQIIKNKLHEKAILENYS